VTGGFTWKQLLKLLYEKHASKKVRFVAVCSDGCTEITRRSRTDTERDRIARRSRSDRVSWKQLFCGRASPMTSTLLQRAGVELEDDVAAGRRSSSRRRRQRQSLTSSEQPSQVDDLFGTTVSSR